MNPSRPRQTLQLNVESFFRSFQSRHAAQMQCAQGCSQCCQVSLTVFPDEAWEIVLWFQSLEEGERQELRRVWQTQGTSPLADAAGNVRDACAFLHERRCTIYPARPVICRSQGLPLLFRVENPRDKSVAIHLDVCPLNFRESGELPPQAEALDLDRLNAMQSLAVRAFEVPEELAPLRDKQGRISLSRLRELLS